MSYIPTTDEVRRAYTQVESTEHYPGVPDERGEGYGWVRADGVEVFGVRNHQERELAEDEFDRWLNQVKAETWTEGFDKGFYRGQILHGDYDASEAGIENPYEVG